MYRRLLTDICHLVGVLHVVLPDAYIMDLWLKTDRTCCLAWLLAFWLTDWPARAVAGRAAAVRHLAIAL